MKKPEYILYDPFTEIKKQSPKAAAFQIPDVYKTNSHICTFMTKFEV